MRALRSSLYTSPVPAPVTTVLLEEGANDTLESIVHRLRVPGALIIHEIFETDSDDIAAVTLEARNLQQENAEQQAHQAMLYFWTVHEWVRVSERGMVFMDKPAPLSREEIVVVFDQLRQHPDYGHRTIISHDRSGAPVEMVDGEIKED